MSKIALSGNSLGTGTLTISAPNTNVDRVLELPDEAGTIATESYVGTQALGVGQTWQDVSGSRTAGVTYTNSTGKPIMVSVRTTATATDFTITVNGVVTAQVTNISTTRMQMITIVPDGNTYVVSGYQGGSWAELR
jgi:hypothetical protein